MATPGARSTLSRWFGWRRMVLAAAALPVVLYGAATVARMHVRKYDVFLADYVRWARTGRAQTGRPTHVFFLVTDHFEPLFDRDRVRRWSARYRALAANHHDSAGRPPQHSWFFPAEQTDAEILGVLRDLTRDGLGEVELHYHHHYDTEPTLRAKLERGIAELQEFGFLKTVDGATHFAFIHGNSGLDNSNGAEMCGVNTELRLLHELGCFCDFTFPSIYLDSQPPTVNNIYAAKDDEGPKSYARPLPLSSLADGSGDLMIFQGPLMFVPSWNPAHLFLDLDDGNVHPPVPGSARRVDTWVRAAVHVAEREDWIFVKIFAHGATSDADEEAVLGSSFDTMLSYLERQYNDGRSYVLHYVTAREAYNLAFAAMKGAAGDPERYFDHPIPPYQAGGARKRPARPQGF